MSVAMVVEMGWGIGGVGLRVAIVQGRSRIGVGRHLINTSMREKSIHSF